MSVVQVGFFDLLQTEMDKFDFNWGLETIEFRRERLSVKLLAGFDLRFVAFGQFLFG
jgi:hypothetical protein